MDKEPNNKNRLSLQSVRESLRTLSLSTLLLIVTTAVALVAVGSLAWMSENTDVDANGIHANIDDELFEIRATIPTPGLSFPVVFPTPIAPVAGSVYQTDNAHSGLQIRLTRDELPQGAVDELEPDSHGHVTFSLIPSQKLLNGMRENDSVRITVKVELEGYKNNAKLTSTPESPLQYLNGHILFFQNYRQENQEDNESPYLYSGFPTSGTFTFTATRDAITANNGYPITLYWVWPRVLDQLVKGEQTINELKQLLSNENVSEMKDIIIANPGLFFKGVASVESSDLVNTSAGKNVNRAYNLADQEIGDNIEYVAAMLSVTAEIIESGGNP